jgi:hypothetical protein
MLKDSEILKIRIIESVLEFEMISENFQVYKYHTFEEIRAWGNQKFILGSIIEFMRKMIETKKFFDNHSLTKLAIKYPKNTGEKREIKKDTKYVC